MLAVESKDPEGELYCPACITLRFVEVDILGHQREVARSHQSEESDSMELRDS